MGTFPYSPFDEEYSVEQFGWSTKLVHLQAGAEAYGSMSFIRSDAPLDVCAMAAYPGLVAIFCRHPEIIEGFWRRRPGS